GARARAAALSVLPLDLFRAAYAVRARARGAAFGGLKQLPHASLCPDLRTIARAVARDDGRRPVDIELAIERRDRGGVRELERERPQPRSQIRYCLHRARLAAPVDDRWRRAVEGKRAVSRKSEVERRPGPWQRNLPAKDALPAGKNAVD